MVFDAGKNKNQLMKKGMSFYDKRKSYLSVFTGYDWEHLDKVNEDVIKGFLNHVKDVIARGEDVVYEYLLNWFSFILQKPGDKTEVALVITGKEGSGKNVFTDVLSKLLGRYANPNLTNINHIVGNFNTALEDKKLIVCNELSSADTNKYLNSDTLKAVITERKVNIEAKGVDARLRENVVNLILVSNHFGPIKITANDRRYLILETSNKRCKDFQYFKALTAGFTRDFYNNLFTFFMNRDISKFNPRHIPDTKERQDLIETNKTSYEMFYEENSERFEEGWHTEECYFEYSRWAKDHGFAVCAANTFGGKMREWINRKQRRTDGQRFYVYVKRTE